MLKNAVVGNYYDTGVRRFALAGSIASNDEVGDLRVALGMSLTVVRLSLSFEIKITKIYYNPLGAETGRTRACAEYVVIKNTGTSRVRLTG